MTHLEILDAKIAAARIHFRTKTNLDYLNSARDIINASAHCGQGVTLNANQTRALDLFLEAETALRETRALQRASAPNIIPFAIAASN
jgi:hypothetical protein